MSKGERVTINDYRRICREIEEFTLDNALPSYFLGVCQDFKHFAFCVSVIILNTEGTRIG